MRRPLLPALLATTLLLTAACNDHDEKGQPFADHDDAARVVTGGSVGDHDRATFAVISGADVVRVRAADLGGDLYRVSTADDAKVRPSVRLDGDTVYAGLADTGDPGPALVTAELSNAVHWQLRFDGGAKEESADLTGGKLTGVSFVAGTSLADVTLPAAQGTIPVTLGGGASQVSVHLTGDAPVRVRVGGGAATVTIDGVRRSGIAGGTDFTPSGWGTATDRYDIDLTSGVSTLTVDRR
ncbi:MULTISPECIES: hypothetical protein [Actinoplanes]|uniref:DUF2154 domain-containing protein n=2 Tax=Actinoplanes TaxID=1865 RepID=A0A0X3VAY9_9ACTN|nr:MULTISPECIES: hypothetical protein [Actinoplanes]KUL40446.1 hypothetical protein ADL15_07455 [Actinoplanes awajinensis subsp. mycoplanecinus]GIE64081.1 hypothetical protein Apa02nite_001890 [Actinoplanes palleronii]